MDYETLFKYADSFYKKSGIINTPPEARAKIWQWVHPKITEWLKSDQSELKFIDRNFELDVSNLPSHYNIPKDKTKIILILKMKEMHDEVDCRGSMQPPSNQENKSIIEIEIFFDKKLGENEKNLFRSSNLFMYKA